MQPEVLRIGKSKTREPREEVWQVYVDGASNCQGVGVGIILISPEGIRAEKSFRLVSLPPTMRLSMKLSLQDSEC